MKILANIGCKFNGVAYNLFFDNLPLLFLQRLFFRGMPLFVHEENQLTFLVDFTCDDENGTRFCLTSDMYARLLKHLEWSLPEGFIAASLGTKLVVNDWGRENREKLAD